MRDPNRIKSFLLELEKIWQKYPDLRFGQFITNIFSKLEIDPFFIEDEILIQEIKNFDKK